MTRWVMAAAIGLGVVLAWPCAASAQVNIRDLEEVEGDDGADDGEADAEMRRKKRLRCDGGRVATDGHCCWPAQTWSEAEQTCGGTPQCPDGQLVHRRTECAPASDDAIAQRGACDGGDAAACGRLGLRYAKGDGVERDDDAALAALEAACEGGIAERCLALASLHADGRGEGADASRVPAYVERACTLGYEAACRPELQVSNPEEAPWFRDPEAEYDGGSSALAWAGGGVTVAGLGVVAAGVILQVFAADDRDRVRQDQRVGPSLTQAEAKQLEEDANSAATTGAILIGVGSGVAVAGVVMLIVGLVDDDEPDDEGLAWDVRIDASGASVGAMWRY